MKVMLLGAPLCGKGSQANLIHQFFNIPHISTGDLFREILSREKDDLKDKISSFINSGNLVPDDITVKLVQERIQKDDCKNGYILDGFPRTLYQAEQFEKIDKLDVVIYIDDELENIIKRVEGRRVCADCKKVFALRNYDKANCDVCGGKLIKREDDNEQTIRFRHNVYLESTFPLVEFYQNKGILKKVKGLDSIADTFEIIKKILLNIK